MARQAASDMPRSGHSGAVQARKRGSGIKVDTSTPGSSESNIVTRELFDAFANAHMTEEALRQQIRRAAGAYGYDIAYHTNRSDRSDPGFPDEIMIHRTRWYMIAIEAKRESGRLSHDQVIWLDALATFRDRTASPIYVYVVRPSDRDALWASMASPGAVDGVLHGWCLDTACERCQQDRKRATLPRRRGR